MNNKYNKLVKDTLIFALGSIGSKFILFFLVPLYTNCLTTEQYGIADLVFTIAQIFIPIISLVIFDAVIRFGLENRKHPENVLLVALTVWIVGLVILLVCMPFISRYTEISEWKWYLYFYIIFNILLSIELNYLKVKGKNLLYSCICIIQTFCLAGLNICLLLVLKTGVSGYLLSNIVACMVASIIAFFIGNFIDDLKKAKFDSLLLKRMLVYSSPLIFNNLAWWIIQSSDKVMVQMLLGSSMLGLYTVATRIPSLINVAVSVFQQSWGISAVVEMDSKNNKEFYSNVFNIFTCMVFISCIALNGIIKAFMKVYVSDEFFLSWKFVPLLVCAAGFSAIAAYFGSIYGALKKSFNNMLSTVTSGILNIIVNFWLIPIIGVEGAVIGTFVSYFYLAYIRMLDCLRYVKIDIDIKKILINSGIVFVHAVMISCEYYIILATIICSILFVEINVRVLANISKMKKE